MLLQNLDKLHTTPMGEERIKKNLNVIVDDIVLYCKNIIIKPSASISRQGKNYYVIIDNCVLTINAYSYTIITAHKLTTKI